MKKVQNKRGRPKGKTKKVKRKSKVAEKWLVRGLPSNVGGTDCFGIW